MRNVTIKPTPAVCACPKCGNATRFKAHSQFDGTDCCEVWVECGKCGFDPTAARHGERYEDVMGGTGKANVCMALSCWNDAITRAAKATLQTG